MHPDPIAPAAVTVELRGNNSRVYRVSRGISPSHLTLSRPAPFEPDRPVQAILTLPGDSTPISINGRMQLMGEYDEEEGHRGTRTVVFEHIDDDERKRVAAYVRDRLQMKNPV